MDAVEIIRGDETMESVAFFWPWIRKEQVDAAGTSGGQEPCQGVGAFQMNDPDICQFLLCGKPADAADASTEALNTKEIALWIVRGHLQEKRAVPTADIQFESAGSIRKDGSGGNQGKIVVRDELQWKQGQGKVESDFGGLFRWQRRFFRDCWSRRRRRGSWGGFFRKSGAEDDKGRGRAVFLYQVFQWLRDRGRAGGDDQQVNEIFPNLLA